MEVTINFDEEVLTPAVKLHLAGGMGVQAYIETAVMFYNEIRELLKDPKEALGIGDVNRIAQYNRLVDVPGMASRGK